MSTTGNGGQAGNGLPVNTNVAMIVGASFLAFVVGALVLLLIALPEGENKALYVGLVINFIAPTVLAAGNYLKTSQVKAQTTALTNGLADAKMRTAVATVVPQHVDPSAQEQLAADRVTVDHWAAKANNDPDHITP